LDDVFADANLSDKVKLKIMPAQSIHAFAEKVALITDGENPVGRAVALQLALQGAYVIVGFANSTEENARAIGELQNLGTLANAVETDVSTVEGARKLVGAVEEMFGRIDLLVNCLKFTTDSSFENVSEEIFDKSLNKNLKAAFFVTQEAVRLMKSRPKPKIVNVVSALDTEETFGNVLLAASQKAVVGLTESLAATLPKNFRVNAVAVSEKKGKSENLDAELFRPRAGISEDDVARTVLFLLSSEAVGLNGQILKVE
jgi:3-oxoacyl-[acyl-carrier protein] reductase